MRAPRENTPDPYWEIVDELNAHKLAHANLLEIASTIQQVLMYGRGPTPKMVWNLIVAVAESSQVVYADEVDAEP